MRNEVKLGLVVVASGILGALCTWFFFGQDSGADDHVKRAREQRFATTSRSGAVKRVTEISVDRDGDKKSVRIVESEVNRPDVLKTASAAEDDDEESLTEPQKAILKDIQDALDDDDVKGLRRAVARFTASVRTGGLGGYGNVPRALRSAAVQAFKWFGKDTIADAVPFLADSDEEIAAEAFDAIEFSLQDVSIGDHRRSAVVKAMAKTMTDPDQIESILNALTDMRNSVKCDTVISIMKEGTSEFKSAMKEQMSFYFDDDVKNEDGVRKWLAENPDDSGDEEFYGGEKE